MTDPECPHCGNDSLHLLEKLTQRPKEGKPMRILWECAQCSKTFWQVEEREHD